MVEEFVVSQVVDEFSWGRIVSPKISPTPMPTPKMVTAIVVAVVANIDIMTKMKVNVPVTEVE